MGVVNMSTQQWILCTFPLHRVLSSMKNVSRCIVVLNIVDIITRTFTY
jgi:hypothetical protein